MASKEIEYILWKKEYITSNTLLDDQHKRFVTIINKLADAINKGCRKNIHDIFFEIIFYIEHYMIEKDINLIDCDKNKYELHKKLHTELLEKVKECYKNFTSSNQLECCKNLHSYLREWFVSYIKLIKKNNFNECWK